MKKLILLLVLFPAISFAQSGKSIFLGIPQTTVSTTMMDAFAASLRTQYISTVDSNKFQPKGLYIEGALGFSTVSGILNTTYVIPHGLSFTPSLVVIQPRSLNAAAFSYTTNYTATTFTIIFSTLPVIGTNNISFGWIAYK